MSILPLIMKRRKALHHRLDPRALFEVLEESCVPSYLHRNPVSAAVAWWRLYAAAKLYRRYAAAGPILDFGSGTGEIGYLVPTSAGYDFVEGNDLLAEVVVEMNPAAQRRTLETLPARQYAVIFALDSLEHNEDVSPLVNRLQQALIPGGIFILSGPTENFLYRLGRKLSGFDGHYHKTNIYAIEHLVTGYFAALKRQCVPLCLPLFRVSAWRNAL